MRSVLAFVLFILCVIDVSVQYGRYPRDVVKILRTSNGGKWGGWGFRSFCAEGTFATGYDMKIEQKQGRGDDTSLNGIRLHCYSRRGRYGGSIYSGVGPWGRWVGLASCKKNDFLIAFSQQVERPQGRGDDTASNFVRFKCRSFKKRFPLDYFPYHDMRRGYWGSFSHLKRCPPNSAICGIQTKLEGPQGRGDDTALNDVKMFCCPTN